MEYDFIVVGGGLVGSSIAYGLARQNYKVAVLDGVTGPFAPRAEISAWYGFRVRVRILHPMRNGPGRQLVYGRSSPKSLQMKPASRSITSVPAACIFASMRRNGTNVCRKWKRFASTRTGHLNMKC